MPETIQLLADTASNEAAPLALDFDSLEQSRYSWFIDRIMPEGYSSPFRNGRAD